MSEMLPAPAPKERVTVSSYDGLRARLLLSSEKVFSVDPVPLSAAEVDTLLVQSEQNLTATDQNITNISGEERRQFWATESTSRNLTTHEQQIDFWGKNLLKNAEQGSRMDFLKGAVASTFQIDPGTNSDQFIKKLYSTFIYDAQGTGTTQSISTFINTIAPRVNPQNIEDVRWLARQLFGVEVAGEITTQRILLAQELATPAGKEKLKKNMTAAVPQAARMNKPTMEESRILLRARDLLGQQTRRVAPSSTPAPLSHTQLPPETPIQLAATQMKKSPLRIEYNEDRKTASETLLQAAESMSLPEKRAAFTALMRDPKSMDAFINALEHPYLSNVDHTMIAPAVENIINAFRKFAEDPVCRGQLKTIYHHSSGLRTILEQLPTDTRIDKSLVNTLIDKLEEDPFETYQTTLLKKSDADFSTQSTQFVDSVKNKIVEEAEALAASGLLSNLDDLAFFESDALRTYTYEPRKIMKFIVNEKEGMERIQKIQKKSTEMLIGLLAQNDSSSEFIVKFMTAKPDILLDFLDSIDPSNSRVSQLSKADQRDLAASMHTFLKVAGETPHGSALMDKLKLHPKFVNLVGRLQKKYGLEAEFMQFCAKWGLDRNRGNYQLSTGTRP